MTNFYETETKWGRLSFSKFDDAAAYATGDIITMSGKPWYWYKASNGGWELYLPRPILERLAA